MAVAAQRGLGPSAAAGTGRSLPGRAADGHPFSVGWRGAGANCRCLPMSTIVHAGDTSPFVLAGSSGRAFSLHARSGNPRPVLRNMDALVISCRRFTDRLIAWLQLRPIVPLGLTNSPALRRCRGRERAAASCACPAILLLHRTRIKRLHHDIRHGMGRTRRRNARVLVLAWRQPKH